VYIDVYLEGVREREGGREGGKEGGRMRVWVHLDTLRVMGGNEGEKGVKEGR